MTCGHVKCLALRAPKVHRPSDHDLVLEDQVNRCSAALTRGLYHADNVPERCAHHGNIVDMRQDAALPDALLLGGASARDLLDALHRHAMLVTRKGGGHKPFVYEFDSMMLQALICGRP